ncbi:hypothetical protein M378DRAFT_165287, partial [Amanita muscaria Koide BX008]
VLPTNSENLFPGLNTAVKANQMNNKVSPFVASLISFSGGFCCGSCFALRSSSFHRS